MVVSLADILISQAQPTRGKALLLKSLIHWASIQPGK
jgi:hypothetical protein